MKEIPSFSITIVRIADVIHILPTFYGSSYLVSTKSVKELRANLENYVERVKIYLRKLNDSI